MSVRTFVAALAALLVASACTTTADTSVEPPPSSAVETVETAPAASGAELRIAMAEPESLHPHHVVSDRAVELAGLLHRPLTVRGADGFAQPALALSWTSDNSITWTFELDPTATFADGEPITATTVATSWQRAAEQSTRARAAYIGIEAGITDWDDAVAGIEGAVIGVQILSPTTLQVQLDRSNPWLPEIVAHPLFAPVRAPDDGGVPVASGPYVATTRGDGVAGLTLTRRDAGDASSPAVVDVEFVTDEAAAIAAVADGRADLTVATSAEAADGLSVDTVAGSTLWYLGYPTSRGPLSQPEPRRVLTMAIDRDTAADRFDSRQADNPRFAPFYAVNSLHAQCRWCTFDLEGSLAAAEELDVEPPENPISLHLVAGGPGEAWADAMADVWRDDLGWPVNVVRWEDLRSMVGFLQSGVPDGPFILPFVGVHPGAEAWISPLLDRNGADDFVRYGNDTLIEHFRLISTTPNDDDERRTLIADLNDTLNDALAFVPLSVSQRHVIHDGTTVTVPRRSGITGVDLAGITVLP